MKLSQKKLRLAKQVWLAQEISDAAFRNQIRFLNHKEPSKKTEAQEFLIRNIDAFIARLSAPQDKHLFQSGNSINAASIGSLIDTIKKSTLDDAKKKLACFLILQQTILTLVTPNFKTLLGRKKEQPWKEFDSSYNSPADLLKAQFRYVGNDYATQILQTEYLVGLETHTFSTDIIKYLLSQQDVGDAENLKGLFSDVVAPLVLACPDPKAMAENIVTIPTKNLHVAPDASRADGVFASLRRPKTLPQGRVAAELLISYHFYLARELVQFLLDTKVSDDVLHDIARTNIIGEDKLKGALFLAIYSSGPEARENFMSFYLKAAALLTDKEKIELYIDEKFNDPEGSFTSVIAEKYPKNFCNCIRTYHTFG